MIYDLILGIRTSRKISSSEKAHELFMLHYHASHLNSQQHFLMMYYYLVYMQTTLYRGRGCTAWDSHACMGNENKTEGVVH